MRFGLFCLCGCIGVFIIAAPASVCANENSNVVIIFTNDQGYDDLGCYGSETVQTPRIDRLPRECMRFASFYAQVVCGPSRSALLTGRYPVRTGGWSMSADEITQFALLRPTRSPRI